MQQLQNASAAKGSLLSGNEAQAEQNYGQNYASNEYNNVYNRSMQQYTNAFNIFNSNQANEYNKLAGLAGTGQTAATTLGQEGQAAAQNVGNIDLTTGAQQGQQLNNAAAATASGYVGGANAWAGGLSGSTGSLTQAYLLNNLLGQGGGGSSGANGTYLGPTDLGTFNITPQSA